MAQTRPWKCGEDSELCVGISFEFDSITEVSGKSNIRSVNCHNIYWLQRGFMCLWVWNYLKKKKNRNKVWRLLFLDWESSSVSCGLVCSLGDCLTQFNLQELLHARVTRFPARSCVSDDELFKGLPEKRARVRRLFLKWFDPRRLFCVSRTLLPIWLWGLW